jgi:hypothetical protein
MKSFKNKKVSVFTVTLECKDNYAPDKQNCDISTEYKKQFAIYTRFNKKLIIKRI